MERGWKTQNGYTFFDMLGIAVWMAGKEKRISVRRERRQDDDRNIFFDW